MIQETSHFENQMKLEFEKPFLGMGVLCTRETWVLLAIEFFVDIILDSVLQ